MRKKLSADAVAKFIEKAKELFGSDVKTLTRKEISQIRDEGISIPGVVWTGIVPGTYPAVFKLPSVNTTPSQEPAQEPELVEESEPDEEPVLNMVNTKTVDTKYLQFIPRKDENFIPSGDNFKIIKNIIAKGKFFPLYIWGISGLGKTFQIEQACSMYNRPLFRVQVTKETTNEDLIGGFALINGNTVWVDGPVLKAYKSGGILLLDEVDLNPSLMIMQVVLENKPVLVPQTGELIYPKEGFNVFATGNTKGDGEGSSYVGTSVLNEAFLERFISVLEQKIPSLKTELRMIDRFLELNNIKLEDKTKDAFLKWIDLTRKNFESENTDIYISTRRVQYILKMYDLLGNFTKSIIYALARYNDEDKEALVRTWEAIYDNFTKETKETHSEE